MTEPKLQKAVIELARRLGWRVAHFPPSRTGSGGWATAVQGDAKGFPDLIIARAGEPLRIVELKANGKYPLPLQRAWLDLLASTGCRVSVWRPRDWDSGLIEQELREAPLRRDYDEEAS